MSVDTARLSTVHNKLGKPGGPGLFGDKSLQLPAYIQNIAKALIRSGKPKSSAIAIAVATVKKWAAGGGGVSPEVRAAAAKAVAEWEAAKAKARATPNKGSVRLANEPDVSNKGMIALELPAGTIAQVPGGVSVDDMHVTLRYLGEDVSDVDFARAIRTTLMACGPGPIAGWVGGLGVFPADADGKVAVWCPVDAPGINQIQNRMSEDTGTADHGFTPHITVKWAQEGDKLPDPIPRTPVTFTHVVVKRGDQSVRLPLGSSPYGSPMADSRYSNPLAVSGREVALSRPADTTTAPAGKQKPKQAPPAPRAGVGKDGGPARFKHGWIPVDKNGNATGPAQKPDWLLKDEAKHKAAGGKTYEQLQAQKAAAQQKAAAHKAGAPARHAAAVAKAKARAAAVAKHKADVAAKKKAAAEKRTATAKEKARQKLITSAYKQALADRKAGRALTDQQKRVVSAVESAAKKQAARLRLVDVPGAAGGPSAPAGPGAPRLGTSPARARRTGPTVGTTPSARARGKIKSFGKTKIARTTHLANEGDERVNSLDFSSAHPLGQLAFRYKHGWILINPGIPSRGRHGSVLATKHGHKSGGVTFGHFEPHPSGKGKTFVPDKHGQHHAVSWTKENKALVKKHYALTAAQKDGGQGDALHPAKPSPEAVKALSTAAAHASNKAQKSGNVADAQDAAKKHAAAFVANQKLGNTGLAQTHKSLAQGWQKKANQLKKAEKDSIAAKDKFDAEQKAAHDAKVKAAEEKAKAAKVEEAKKKYEALVAANKKYNTAFGMPQDTADQKTAKAKAFTDAAKDYEPLKTGHPDHLIDSKHEQSVKFAKDLHAQAMAQMSKDAEKKAAPPVKKAAAPKPPAPPAKNVSDHVADVLDDLDMGASGSYAQWDDYLHASAAYKQNPTPANLKTLSAAQKSLMDSGASMNDLQTQNGKLFKAMGLQTGKKAAAKPPAKKTAFTPLPQSSPPKAPVPAGDQAITLPGPGMYADGKAIQAAENKLAAMDSSSPNYEPLKSAIADAKAQFKSKHGNTYAGDKAGQETGAYSGGTGYTSNVTHAFYNDAVAAGYQPVANDTSANGSWKPSQVPGLSSHNGAYTYSGGSYTAINAQLRKYKSPTGGSNDATIAQMDKEFSHVPPLDHGIVTIRQMSNDGPFPGNPPPMTAGDEFVDHGYSSTSKQVGAWSGDVVMEVRIPKGTRVLDLNHTTGSQHSHEQEVLLNRGTKYRIVSDTKQGDGRKIVVEVVS